MVVDVIECVRIDGVNDNGNESTLIRTLIVDNGASVNACA